MPYNIKISPLLEEESCYGDQQNNSPSVSESASFSSSSSPSPSVEAEEELTISQLIEKLEMLKILYGNIKVVINGCSNPLLIRPATNVKFIKMWINRVNNITKDCIYID
jgi:hypothetical protein